MGKLFFGLISRLSDGNGVLLADATAADMLAGKI